MSKFTVIKNEDIELLDHAEQHELLVILEQLEGRRINKGKKLNEYAVINLDEPYAGEVIRIMKAHGHWGESNA